MKLRADWVGSDKGGPTVESRLGGAPDKEKESDEGF